MDIETKNEGRWLYFLVRIFALLSASLGLCAIIGWSSGYSSLASFGTASVPMAPSTAILFLIFGTAIFLHGRYPQEKAISFSGIVVSAAGIIISLILFILNVTGNLSTHEFLGLNIIQTSGLVTIGHMSPVTAIMFILTGGSFLLRILSINNPQKLIQSFIISNFVLLTSIVLLCAYFVGTPFLYGTSIIPPALPTSLGFTLLNAALTLLSVHVIDFSKKSDDAPARNEIYYAITFLAVSVIILAIIGKIYFANFSEEFKQNAGNQLHSIAELKASQIHQFNKERLGDANIFYQNNSFSILVNNYLKNDKDAAAEKELRIWLNKYQAVYQYESVFLCDVKGNPRITIPDKTTRISNSINNEIQKINKTLKITFVDLNINEYDKKIYLGLLIPIFDDINEGRVIATVFLRINPEKYLYELISRWPTLSKTAETLILRRDGNDALFLNELKFQKNTALNLRIPLSKKEVPAVKAVLGEEGIVEGIDYRGEPVLAYLTKIPESPWYMVARVDRAEVYAQLTERFWQIMILFGSLLLAAGAISGFIWRTQRAKNYKEKYEFSAKVIASEIRYRRLFESAKDGILILDAETGMIVDVNPFLTDLLGYSHEKFLGKAIWEIGFFKNIVANKDNFLELQQKEYIRYEDMPLETSDGQIREVEFVSNVYLVDNAKVIQCNIRDITERKLAEKEQTRLLYLLDSSLNEISIFNSENLNFEYVNKGVLRNTGYSLEALKSMTPVDLKPMFTESSFREMISPLLEHASELLIFQTVHRRFDGSCYTVEAHIQLVEYGDHHSFLSIIQDITERQKAEAEVHKLNSELEDRVVERTSQLEEVNKELEAFSYSVSHDLRAPLRYITGYAEMLTNEYQMELADEGQRYVNNITQAASSMKLLIDDLLQFSRTGRIQMEKEAIDMGIVCKDAVGRIKELESNREIKWAIAPLPKIFGDYSLLKLVWINLLSNAVKFTRLRKDAEIKIGTEENNEEYIFSVRDNGVGFEMKYAGKLFGVFQRLHSSTEFEGTGIGLANTKRIITRHGGKVWAESEMGEGATFYFTIPKSNK